MTKSKAFFAFCCAFIAGIGLHSLIAADRLITPPFIWYALFIGCGVLSALGFSFGGSRLTVIGILALGIFFLGVFRFAQVIPVINARHIAYYVGQEISVRGLVDSPPRKREKNTAYILQLSAPSGKLLLNAPTYPEYRFGDELFIKCAPQPLSFYERWAVREGVHVSCAFPEHVSVMRSAAFNVPPSGGLAPALLKEMSGVRGVLYQIREIFHSRLQSLFPDPYGGLLAGILYGDTSGLTRELKEAFRATGLAHITALSGYNITIISWVLVGGLVYVGLTRKQALPVTLLLILVFVLATGAESSVVRAAIMGSLVSLAQGVGRARHPRNALALAGVIMLAVNPRLLRFDLGFLLSFVATIALIYFADDIARRTLVRKLPEVWEIRKAGAASVAALLFTTPLLLYHTGILGPFSLFANILVVPMVPAVMALGFLSVVADFLWRPFGLGIALVARVPLQYIVRIAEWLAQFGVFQIRLSFLSAVVLFCAIVWTMRQWKRQENPQQKSPLIQSEESEL
ncbi:ComEC/Rec2 family competence protein [Candidatus Uhrbacteria bacterium]|nr:ComEC/Rec2 family competence protein [Candidatus Uhrbacteria bacterium]